MASSMDMLSAGIFLVVNTVVIAAYALMGGPIFGSLTSFTSGYNYTGSVLQPSMIQWIPGFFFLMLLVLELALVIRLGYVVVSKTDYQGEQEW